MQNSKQKSIPSDSYTIDFRMLIGFLVGIGLVLLTRLSANRSILEKLAAEICYPVGTVFLRVLLMAMIPYILFTLSGTIANFGVLDRVRSIALRFAAYSFWTTMIAILVGQCLVSYFEPGKTLRDQFLLLPTPQWENTHDVSGVVKSLVADPSDGKITFVYFAASVVGLLLTLLPKRHLVLVVYVLRAGAVVSLKLVGHIMFFAPVAVACLTVGAITPLTQAQLKGVGGCVAIIGVGLCLQMFVVYPLALRFFARYPVRAFFYRSYPAILASFLAGTSNAIIPLTESIMRSRLGVPERISSIVAPLGANFNLDGTALFEAVVIVFLAQAYGIELTLFDHAAIVGFVLFTAVGLPGVPGTAIPVLASCAALVGIPIDGLGLIVGLDGCILMFRTAVNTTGDLVGALYVTERERQAPDWEFVGKADPGLPFQSS